LSLSRPTAADLEPVHAIHADPRTHGYNIDGPHLDLARTREMFDIIEEQWETDGFGYWVVRSIATGNVIGTGGLRRIVFDDRPVLNLYYRFAPAVWGNGYATELAQASIELAERDLPGVPVVARIHPDNKPSIAVAERAGMINLGIRTSDGHPTVILATYRL
jgi:RimJ/RimL family protein N-acetyltransferase